MRAFLRRSPAPAKPAKRRSEEMGICRGGFRCVSCEFGSPRRGPSFFLGSGKLFGRGMENILKICLGEFGDWFFQRIQFWRNASGKSAISRILRIFRKRINYKIFFFLKTPESGISHFSQRHSAKIESTRKTNRPIRRGKS